MLNITYALNDAKLAETIQKDLSAGGLRLERPILVVLITPESVADETVQKSIRDALKADHRILPVLIRDAKLPESIAGLKTLDLRGGYKGDKLVLAVKRLDLGEDLMKSNQRYLFWLSSAALLVFVIAIGSLATGITGPPTNEYATENALREGQIETLVFPTLDGFMPRTTQDAIGFPLTVEANPTRNRPFLIGTATALPLNRQATQSALETSIVETEAARMTATQQAGEVTAEATEAP